MAELCDKVSQYISINPSEIRLLITDGGGELIHIAWLLACTVVQAEKVLINPPEDTLSKKVLAHIKKRFEVSLAPVLIYD